MDSACPDSRRHAGDGGAAVTVRVLSGTQAHAAVPGLTDVLLDCVAGGASVSFMAPLDRATAEGFWRSVVAGVERGERILLVAEDREGVLGTVQLVVGQPPNQPHRADLSKMLVHRRGRRRGIGAALMQAAEEAARAAGKTLLVLDTASPDAERLYTRAGWVKVGVIPNFALWPEGGFCDTAFFYKALG
ncbi:GNAT family N-acetyltransferase [Azospirillum sp. YIM B02556]|uniref:GNAT family N-acetyltransferase n=1 Tax=Azospirillum endophyticum TaxID=2800326 RepID=A0ABS1EZA2_9PROT|nr:GNAT family N-acetyltransferase [Azospirillum endophyticum]MBK1836495.1 GNAT family N-acetyltransferase [Azospirillum endophyticum]